MTKIADIPFWYFKKNKTAGYTLELRGLYPIPIKTNVVIDEITRLKAEFCSELEIELIHALLQNIEAESTEADHLMSDLERFTFIAQALGSTRYKTPLVLDTTHLSGIVLGELFIGDVIEMDLKDNDVRLFITGIFDDSLQAVVLNSSNDNVFKTFQNLYLRDI